MGLHPGSRSLGCATVKSTSTPYDKSADWKKLRAYLDQGKLTYKNDSFRGFFGRR